MLTENCVLIVNDNNIIQNNVTFNVAEAQRNATPENGWMQLFDVASQQENMQNTQKRH